VGEKLLGRYSYVLEGRGGGREMVRARKRAVVLKGMRVGRWLTHGISSRQHVQLGHSSGTMQMRSEYIPYLPIAEVVTKEDPHAATTC
jgi:hypothetical protein